MDIPIQLFDNFLIIPIQALDVDPILELAFNEMDTTLQKAWVEGFDWNQWLRDLLSTLKDDQQVVFRIETIQNEFIGFLWLDHDFPILWITSIVLKPTYQRKGLGTQIICKLEDYAESKGYNALQLGVQAINPAIRFYQRLGFIETGKADYAGTILMRKDLLKKKKT
ncbi:MAG: GNAT family N-acetyltransferase [Candidatus Hodarchaeota archaeon]